MDDSIRDNFDFCFCWVLGPYDCLNDSLGRRKAVRKFENTLILHVLVRCFLSKDKEFKDRRTLASSHHDYFHPFGETSLELALL